MAFRGIILRPTSRANDTVQIQAPSVVHETQPREAEERVVYRDVAIALLRFTYIVLPTGTEPKHPRIRHDDQFYPYFKELTYSMVIVTAGVTGSALAERLPRYSSDPNSPRSPPNEQEAADTVFAYWTRVRALEYLTELLAQSGPEEELNSFRFSFGSKVGTRSRARELGDHHVSLAPCLLLGVPWAHRVGGVTTNLLAEIPSRVGGRFLSAT
ncbi:hypothetical protein Taro_010274 [Colocasia esculenta]|uniref:Uncharacterized protein n=1 Tax=Colocasia esculenta TaxID=4460 RepID=A0A843TYH3_COLES|nr:hypothetical protein [Colocasia esculenta]